MEIVKGKYVWSQEEIEGPVEHIVHPTGVGWQETPYGAKKDAEESARRDEMFKKLMSKKRRKPFDANNWW